MAGQCKECGSYAINPHCHGREPGVDLDLCDVCYWRARASAPRAEAVAAKDAYYLASFKRKSLDGCVTWWGPDSAGYSTDLEYAGIYTAAECARICRRGTEEYTVPVPVSFINGLRVRRTVDPGDTLNRPFWNADDLRAAIAQGAVEGERNG